MRNSKHKTLLVIIFGALLLIGLIALYWWQRGDALPVQPQSQDEETEQLILRDDESTYAGRFRESLVTNGLKSFTSTELGISLQYPQNYLLFENKNVESGPYDVQTLFITLEEPMLDSIKRARMGMGSESPEAVVITFTRNIETFTLSEWLQSGHSNYVESDSKSSLTSTTIDGLPAFSYHASLGLRESDYIAFLYKDWTVLISSASALNDVDVQTIIDSIQFTSN